MRLEELDIITHYGRIHVYKKGDGDKKLLLLHGAGCDSAMLSWREVLEEFSEDYTVYAPDHLGYGKSDKPDGLCGENFYNIHISCIRELADQLGLKEFALAGLSMGGAFSIGFSLACPERVKCLFLVDSWGLVSRMPMHRLYYWYIYKTDVVAQYRWIAKARWMAKWSISCSLIGDKSKIAETLIDEVWEACKGDEAGKSMQDFQRSSITRDGVIPYYGEDLKKLTMPVAFINGEKDTQVTAKTSREAAKKVPNGRFVLLPGCKHWSVKEMPERFYEIVNETYPVS